MLKEVEGRKKIPHLILIGYNLAGKCPLTLPFRVRSRGTI
jgi:hypothetical protein